ncbi:MULTISPECIES: YraN family protein [Brevibacillus]|uniref:YraN family protein n=1 Tax=Brevibacillus TaxID=55080 RepID=UPI00156BA53E|nr:MULTISPECIES: YraN family protein [Brevibacillus]MBU8711442.1 YraN family protein [Brevibacillus parabrevis]MED2254056.1 YraN family protein [Brevibacillus parabrevis]UED67018.1 YraN family protein [Brevibacillus sp. HD3.3A]
MSDRRRLLGQKGEQLAMRYLAQKGYRIVEQNTRTKQGEIDLIVQDDKTLVFVEVRTRSSLTFGTAAESVTWKKKQKLRQLAMAYIQAQQQPIASFRFDVVAIFHPGGNDRSEPSEPVIEHFMNAF